MTWRRATLATFAVLITIGACGGTAQSSVSAPAASASMPGESAAVMTTSTPAVAAPCTERELAFDSENLDLTGAWLANDDGIYYLRQVGDTLWWSGMSGQAGSPASLGRVWNNVAMGTIGEDLQVEVAWADVPRGQVLGTGTMIWEIVDDGTGNTNLRKVSATGDGFGGEEFTPCSPG